MLLAAFLINRQIEQRFARPMKQALEKMFSAIRIRSTT
jgi:hypothetical protein